ncbi:MAG: hypothetical protein U5L96_08320 [Owenweeksia sp.]|nr:hypothetical protein [Owenweeksia sp.]
MQVAILNQCDTSSQYVNFQKPDSISGQVNEISCYEKQLTFTSSTRLECNSIAPDGTDFALYNGQGTLVPIISATAVSCQAGLTKEVRITLHDSIRSNDTLQLITRVGSDFNSLVSSCGLFADAER